MRPVITFVDLGPVPTVHLFLRVAVPLGNQGWTWGELPQYAGCLAREFAYTAAECASLVHTYGRTMAQLLPRNVTGDRFSILAKGPVTGLTLGIREWQWSADIRDFRPVGEYLSGWREACKAYYVKTGELFHHRRFDPSVRMAELVPLPLPAIPSQPRARLAA
jgi:hypothetical protein